MLAKARALVIAALAGTLALGLAPAQGAQSPELQLRRVFEALREGRRPAALEEADRRRRAELRQGGSTLASDPR